MKGSKQRGRRRWIEIAWIGGIAAAGGGVAFAFDPIPTTLDDFFVRGTQPGGIVEPLSEVANNCSLCHGEDTGGPTLPYNRWATSMMAQSARDPIFYACLAIANQDVLNSGEMCLRCHTPSAWVDGRSSPPDGSALGGPNGEFIADFEGVSCSVCHRMVDPDPNATYPSGRPRPAEDAAILAALQVAPNGIPVNPGNANFVFDPADVRRGPLNLEADWPGGFHYHRWAESPFHMESRLCATCHDVSNPAYSRQPDGSYAPNSLDEPHPTQDKHDMFPVERTYSEWSASLFAQGPVDLGEFTENGNSGPRFGGIAGPAVSSCQDCHMPREEGFACVSFLSPPLRDEVPRHDFVGVNNWVLKAVRYLYPDSETGLSAAGVNAAIARVVDMQRRASDLELTQTDDQLNVRVINMTGHKLPTGYHEGRRMWVNVKFLDAQGNVVREHGAYDYQTATLTADDTKVYEAKMGIDETIAALTGHTPGVTLRFALNNKIYFDNRIPPMGFTNAAFEAVQAQPVGYTYADGQYWDDTQFPIPAGAARAEVRVFHQITTREYIEFLRDENTTNSAGQTAYQLWEMFGKSEPVEKDFQTIEFAVACAADRNGDGAVNASDITAFLADWFADRTGGTLNADFNGDGAVNASDITSYLGQWFADRAGGGC